MKQVVAPFSYLADEEHLVDLAQALRSLDPARAEEPAARAAAFAAAGLTATPAEAAEALRRARLFWAYAAPALSITRVAA